MIMSSFMTSLLVKVSSVTYISFKELQCFLYVWWLWHGLKWSARSARRQQNQPPACKSQDCLLSDLKDYKECRVYLDCVHISHVVVHDSRGHHHFFVWVEYAGGCFKWIVGVALLGCGQRLCSSHVTATARSSEISEILNSFISNWRTVLGLFPWQWKAFVKNQIVIIHAISFWKTGINGTQCQ